MCIKIINMQDILQISVVIPLTMTLSQGLFIHTKLRDLLQTVQTFDRELLGSASLSEFIYF